MGFGLRKIKHALLCFLFLPILIASAQKSDFQIWNYDSVSGPINSYVDFYANLEFRFRNNARDFYYTHEQIEFSIRLLPFLYLGPSYRQIWVKNSKTWTGISEPNINLVLQGDVHGFTFYDRSRVAYRIFYDNTQDALQYRNKFGIAKLLWRKPTEIQIYVEDEFFLQQHKRGIYENRTSIVMNVKIIKQLHFEVGYRYRILRTDSSWTHDNILLVNMCGFF